MIGPEDEELANDGLSELCWATRARAETERKNQQLKGTKLACNAEMTPAEVRDFCRTDTAAQGLLKAAMNQLHLSARAFHRVLKLARTIADLAGSKEIGAAHLAQGLIEVV